MNGRNAPVAVAIPLAAAVNACHPPRSPRKNPKTLTSWSGG